MVLVDSLLTAIVRADGDALVMHVGERPYVVAPAGPVELSSRPLTLDAVSGMLGQLLPLDSRRALEELGAVEHELPASDVAGPERFTVVAARGGDDIWIEVRRHRQPVQAPAGLHELAIDVPAALAAEPQPAPPAGPQPPQSPPPHAAEATSPMPVLRPAGRPERADEPDQEPTTRLPIPPSSGHAAGVHPASAPPPPDARERIPEPVGTGAMAMPPAHLAVETAPPRTESPVAVAPQAQAAPVGFEARVAAPPPVESPEHVADAPAPVSASGEPAAEAPHVQVRAEAPPSPRPRVPAFVAPVAPPPRPSRPMPAPVAEAPPVVRPIARVAARPDAGPRPPAQARATAERLVAAAVSQGAQALFLMSNARPAMRLDGDIVALDSESPLGPAEIEAMVDALAGDESREAVRAGAVDRWETDLPDAGRIRCLRFTDRRGPGCVVGLLPERVPAIDQLGLPRAIQGLAQGSDGLVVVAGSRASGRSTLVAALVDQVNRSRGDYVVTLEREIRFAHDNRSALVSQRVVRADESGRAAWSALAEDPDLLVVEDIRSGEALLAAVEAAGTGRLAIVSVLASDAASALEQLADLVEPERRAALRHSMARVLRGVVCQVLLKKNGGGRVAARELALASPEVASIVEAGHFDQLATAMEAGRADGMVPLADALVAFVQSGAVDVREAWRKAPVRAAFLSALRREGLDTSFVERLA